MMLDNETKHNPRFWDVQAEMAAALASLKQEDLSPEEQETLEAYLADIQEIEAEKIDRFCEFRRTLKDRAANARSMAEAFMEKVRVLENRIARMDASYLEALTAHGRSKVTGMVHSVSVGLSDSVEVVPDFVNVLPPKYVVIPEAVPRPDKKAIKAAIKSGEDVPGASIKIGRHLLVK